MLNAKHASGSPFGQSRWSLRFVRSLEALQPSVSARLSNLCALLVSIDQALCNTRIPTRMQAAWLNSMIAQDRCARGSGSADRIEGTWWCLITGENSCTRRVLWAPVCLCILCYCEKPDNYKEVWTCWQHSACLPVQLMRTQAYRKLPPEAPSHTVVPFLMACFRRLDGHLRKR